MVYSIIYTDKWQIPAVFTNTDNTEVSDDSDDGGFVNRPGPETDERGFAVRTSRAPQTNSTEGARGRNNEGELGNDRGTYSEQRDRDAGPTEEEEQEESK